MTSGLINLYQLDESIYHFRGTWCIYFYNIYRNSCQCANSEDLDQMPHSVASDLGLYCLAMSLTFLWDPAHFKEG